MPMAKMTLTMFALALGAAAAPATSCQVMFSQLRLGNVIEVFSEVPLRGIIHFGGA